MHDVSLIVDMMAFYVHNVAVGLVLLGLVTIVLPFNPLLQSGPKGDETDKCFCQLEGKIDDCMCNVDTVDFFNNMKMYPRLMSLLQKDYFRYFKYNAHKPCPFWKSPDEKCAHKSCGVRPCTLEELPPGLKASPDVCERPTGADDSNDDKVDSTISDSARADLKSWRHYDDSQSRFCELDSDSDDNCPDCDYVDLTLNPERFTGYMGEASHRVWRAIYEENCFRPTGAAAPSTSSTKNQFSAAFLPDTLEGMCLEKRAFYRAISGLHTSITVHLTSQHPDGTHDVRSNSLFPGLSNAEIFGPNLNEFLTRFNPETTNGLGPYWLKNLYFVYLLELRAIAKAAQYLDKQPFFTGNDEEDKETQIVVKELLNLMRSFPDHFDETTMFRSGDTVQKLALKEEFRQHFRNVSLVMDCVGCDKCRLWGKLQVTGLGTALKILFSSPESLEDVTSVNPHYSNTDTYPSSMQYLNASDSLLPSSPKDGLQLSRNEIVALFNAFGRISTSIQQLERFRQMMR